MVTFWRSSREGIVALAIAVLVELVNRGLLGKHGAGAEFASALAIAVAVIGVLLSIHRHALTEDQRTANARVQALANTVEFFSDPDQPDAITAIARVYSRIVEPEFADVKRKILDEATRELQDIYSSKRARTFGKAEYYEWLFSAFDRLSVNDYMHAVSLSSDAEWNDSPEERKFLKKNIEAASRGASIVRIFIIERHRLARFVQLPPIKAHLNEAENGLKALFVDRTQLERADAKLLKDVGEGFIDFSGHVGLDDIFDRDGVERGQVTLDPHDRERMATIYSRLQAMAVPLSEALDGP